MTERVLPGTRLRPVLYLMLFVPMGITNGYAVVALAYLLSQSGVTVGAIAGLVGWSLMPQTWRAVWAPLVDATLSVRAWYVISASVSGILMAITGFIPATQGNFAAFHARRRMCAEARASESRAHERLPKCDRREFVTTLRLDFRLD